MRDYLCLDIGGCPLVSGSEEVCNINKSEVHTVGISVPGTVMN